MPLEIWNFVGRKPRHHVADASRVSVCLSRAIANCAGGLTAELIDFARNGAQLRVAVEPDASWPSNGEAIVLELRSEQPGLDIRLPGKIRWHHADGPGLLLIGCEFDEEVSLETLGELFLNEILSDGRLQADEEAPAAVEQQAPQG